MKFVESWQSESRLLGKESCFRSWKTSKEMFVEKRERENILLSEPRVWFLDSAGNRIDWLPVDCWEHREDCDSFDRRRIVTFERWRRSLIISFVNRCSIVESVHRDYVDWRRVERWPLLSLPFDWPKIQYHCLTSCKQPTKLELDPFSRLQFYSNLYSGIRIVDGMSDERFLLHSLASLGNETHRNKTLPDRREMSLDDVLRLLQFAEQNFRRKRTILDLRLLINRTTKRKTHFHSV